MKLGYFYNLPFSDTWPRHDNRLVLAFREDHFEFKLINPNLVKHLEFSRMSYYSFDYPILYSEDSSGNICHIDFIQDFSTRYHNELTGIAKELYVPFMQSSKTSNPCNKLKDTTASILTQNSLHPTIYINGLDLVSIDEDDYYTIKRGETPDSTEIYSNLFYRTAITYYALYKIVRSIKEDSFRLGLYTLPVNPEPNSFYPSCIRLAKEYVNSVNIKDILSDITVEVTESFRHKRDDDDSYSVWRTASVKDELVKKDLYLSRLLGLGTQRIYHDSGYCSAESMALKDLITGIYEGASLEEEKNKIMSEYSKEEHIGSLLSETFSEIMNNQHHLEALETALGTYRNILAENFRMSAISNNGRSFEQQFYDLHSRYNKHPQDTIDKINDIISKTTKCSLSNEILNKLADKSFGLPSTSYPPNMITI